MKTQVTKKQKGICRLGSILFSSCEIWSLTFVYLPFWVSLKKESMVLSISIVQKTCWRFWKKSEISTLIILKVSEGNGKASKNEITSLFGQKNLNCFFFFCWETCIVIKVCFWRVKIYKGTLVKKICIV